MAPFVVRRLTGPRAASTTSKLCMAVTLAAAIAAIVFIRFFEVPGTRQYLFFTVPFTIFTGVTCVYWTVIGLMYAKRSDLESTIKNRERRARTRRLVQ